MSKTERVIALLILITFVLVVGVLFTVLNHEPYESYWTAEPTPTPVNTPTPTPTKTHATASWYSQESLLPARKVIANDNYGVATALNGTRYRLGTRFVVCSNRNTERCITVTVNDYCEACENWYKDRKFDLSEEAARALEPEYKKLGVLQIEYYELANLQ